MAIEKRSKQIGGHTYEVTQLDAIKGRKAFVRLGNAIGPSFSKAGGDAIASLLTNLKEADMDYFCELFGQLTDVSGGEYDKPVTLLPQRFLQHFAGNYLEMIEWLVFAVEVNFGSFFEGVGKMLETITPAKKSVAGTLAAASPSK